MYQGLRWWFFLLALVCCGLVAGGYVLGEVLRVQPCPLCIFQRLLYLLLALLALGAAAVPRAARVWLAAFALTALGGVATAGYQSWLQWNPEESRACGFGEPTRIEQIVDWFGVRWPELFMATGFCASKDWVFLGLSLGNWSALCFLVLAAVAAKLLVRRGPA